MLVKIWLFAPPVNFFSTCARLPKGHDESKKQLDGNNPNYFMELLPSKQNWRLFPDFRSGAVYLDIETTGMDAFSEIITTIAMYDGSSIFHYVNGQNLYDFKKDITKYNLIITYNPESRIKRTL